MMTWLPHPFWFKSVSALNDKDLGKQCHDVMDLLESLLTQKELMKGQVKMPELPIYKLWRGYERALSQLGVMTFVEWERRSSLGHRYFYHMLKLQETANQLPDIEPHYKSEVHRSHAGKLLRRDLVHYTKAFEFLGIEAPKDWRWMKFDWSHPSPDPILPTIPEWPEGE